MVGGTALVRIPAEFSGGAWEQYESELVGIFADWVRTHPGGLVLDIGSSIGIYSAIALFSDQQVQVVAFDSDLCSLAAVRRVCQHAIGDRLRLVHGFLTETPSEVTSLDSAESETEATLVRTGVRGSVGTTRYLCLTDLEARAVPRRRLDDLFAEYLTDERPILMKCDVEGAELLVLSGGKKLLRRARPDLLLSVHPPVLPNYGYSKNEVETFLKRLNYEIQVLSVDHEEHWWCVCR